MKTPKRWSLATRAQLLGAAYTAYEAVKNAQRQSHTRYVAQAHEDTFESDMADVSSAQTSGEPGEVLPSVQRDWVVSAGWLQACARETEQDDDEVAPAGSPPGNWVLWLSSPGDEYEAAMRNMLDDWPAIGWVTIQTESGQPLLKNSVITTDWYLLPDVLPTDTEANGTPLPLRFHSSAPIVAALLAGQIDHTSDHFGISCTLAWITDAPCQRPVDGEVFVRLVITVPDDWDKARPGAASSLTG